MVEPTHDWHVVNVRDARWLGHDTFGNACVFERDARFPHTGVTLFVLEPGKPNCRYHRENAQEDFLVVAGRCKLLIDGEERDLDTWDFVHCGPGVDHVLVGTDRPCAVLAIGHRPERHELFYPESDLARGHGAETPEPTPDPAAAYADVGRREPIAAPRWPIDRR